MKKIGLIALIVVLSLGIIGVGYAAWTQTLNVSGTVTAATFGVKFENAASNDAGTAVDPSNAGSWTFSGTGIPPYTWSGTNLTQNVASTTGVITTVTKTNDTLTITLTNAYPGYFGSVAADVLNTGTVPVKMTAVQSAITPSGTGTAATDINITYSGVFNDTSATQINASSAFQTGFITIGVGTEGGASTEPPMTGGTYTFTVTLTANQVN
jgi:predicted ribosomally synthesized peptide with SipW-like signal peptide